MLRAFWALSFTLSIAYWVCFSLLLFCHNIFNVFICLQVVEDDDIFFLSIVSNLKTSPAEEKSKFIQDNGKGKFQLNGQLELVEYSNTVCRLVAQESFYPGLVKFI